jgi:hypothetical protein
MTLRLFTGLAKTTCGVVAIDLLIDSAQAAKTFIHHQRSGAATANSGGSMARAQIPLGQRWRFWVRQPPTVKRGAVSRQIVGSIGIAGQLAFFVKSLISVVLRGSNSRHSPCKGDALPTELGTRVGAVGS